LYDCLDNAKHLQLHVVCINIFIRLLNILWLNY
jgi:hypothetical protein